MDLLIARIHFSISRARAAAGDSSSADAFCAKLEAVDAAQPALPGGTLAAEVPSVAAGTKHIGQALWMWIWDTELYCCLGSDITGST